MYRPFEGLPEVLREKSIQVRFPRGYRRWKKQFHLALKGTMGDVLKTLNQPHGSNSR